MVATGQLKFWKFTPSDSAGMVRPPATVVPGPAAGVTVAAAMPPDAGAVVALAPVNRVASVTWPRRMSCRVVMQSRVPNIRFDWLDTSADTSTEPPVQALPKV